MHQAYDIVFGWLPALYLGSGLIALGLIRRGGSHGFWAIACCLLASSLLGLRYYVTRIEPERLVVREIEIVTDRVSAPFRIVHITDTHFPGWGDYENRVMEVLAGLGADMILHTGDFVQVVPPAEFKQVWATFRQKASALEPPHGFWGVFGDTDVDLMRLPLDRRPPVRFLSSRSALVETEVGRIHLHGLNLTQSRFPDWGLRSIEPWLAASPPDAFRIVLGHAPDFAIALVDAPVDLILAGHTHGGQVRLPGVGPLVIDSEVPKEWAMGFRRIGRPFLNVGAGAGSNRHEGLPPIRFLCPTELTVITLLPAFAADQLR